MIEAIEYLLALAVAVVLGALIGVFMGTLL